MSNWKVGEKEYEGVRKGGHIPPRNEPINVAATMS
jgi:hypothetical protein